MDARRLGLAASAVAGTAVLGVHARLTAAGQFFVDDAYISFRYAQNLADGLGLVWNSDERVEGYTNFLFVVVLAIGAKLGVAPEVGAQWVSWACGAAVLVAVAAFAARRSGWSDPLVWVAPGLLLAIRPFVTWSSGGLETMMFAALVTGGLLWRVVEEAEDRRPLGSSLLLALATLTRPDGVLFYGLAGATVLLGEVRRRRLRWDVWAAWLAPALLLIGHVAFRYGYYGYWLPNTFYVKVEGTRWARGWWYVGLFHHDTGLGWSAALVAVGVLLRRGLADLLFAAAITLQVAYVASVGGDIFEFRFFVVVLPIGAWLLTDLARDLPVPQRARGPLVVAVALLVGARAAIDGEAGDRMMRRGVASARSMQAYSQKRLRQGEQMAGLVESLALPADLRIATAGAGALPYATGLETTDVLGLNDEVVAHEGIELEHGRPGHEKRASREHLTDRGVEMLDVTGRFVYPGPGPTKAALEKALVRVRRFNKTPGDAPLILRCRRVEGGHLLFASPMTTAEFQTQFGHLEACAGAEEAAAWYQSRTSASP